MACFSCYFSPETRSSQRLQRLWEEGEYWTFFSPLLMHVCMQTHTLPLRHRFFQLYVEVAVITYE